MLSFPTMLIIPMLAAPTFAPFTDGTSTARKTMSMSETNACVLDASSTLFCKGDVLFGQLARAPEEYGQARRFVPVAKAIREVAVGFHFICAIDKTKTLGCWGGNENTYIFGERSGKGTRHTPVPLLKDATQVDAGWGHVCAIDGAQDLYCWGTDHDGQVGKGASGGRYRKPIRISRNVRQVSVGTYGTCAVMEDGRLACWGSNHHGQRGVSAKEAANVRTPTFLETEERYKQVSAGFAHTCAVTQRGGLDCWGDGRAGQTGSSSMASSHEPTRVMEGVEEVAAGYHHTCAITTSKALYCWGNHRLEAIKPKSTGVRSDGAIDLGLGDARSGEHLPELIEEDVVEVIAHDGATYWRKSAGNIRSFRVVAFDDHPPTLEQMREKFENIPHRDSKR